MVVKDIEREDIEHVCKSLGCGPIASLDHFTADKLASAELVEEVQTGASKTVRVTGIAKQVNFICKIHFLMSSKLRFQILQSYTVDFNML